MGRALPVVRNVAKAWGLLVGLCAALGAFGWWLSGYRVASIFVFCGLLLGVAAYLYADRVAMGMVGARELLPGEAPGLHSTVERLALRAGVVKPRLYVISDGFPRAVSAGRGATSSALAVSTGLLGLPAPAELEGVLAHEIAHVRNRDVLVQTTAVVLAASLVELSRIGGALSRALLYVLGPVAASFVHLLLSPRREFDADRLAAELCDSPHGLADALVRLEQASELVEFRASPATEPLYTINPFIEKGLAGLFVTHPPVAERVRRLRDLDPDWREKLRAA
ncbi:MAG TPA: M48 family metalloprotease [Gaiellaceae bacterium]|nr:M48 family metalloprotease [Gaiellaceae bacterium]